jgi:uncharacterized protein
MSGVNSGIIQKTKVYIKETLEGAEAGHDWSHIERVWKLSRHIRAEEGKGDVQVVELGALLHDISDPKFNGGDEEKGSQLAYHFLQKEGVPSESIEHIQTIIKHISFKGGHRPNFKPSVEFKIVQDADRLDAMGAIGVARAFHYGGYKNRALYDPTIGVKEYGTVEEYHGSTAPTINHFYEKLLKLKDLMNTSTGRRLAMERHHFMLSFLEQFYRDVDPGFEGPDPDIV